MPAATAWLAQAEGLGQVVVGAHLEAEDAIELTRLRRQHQDQQLGADGPEPAADLEAVHTGEHQVDHHEFGVGVHGRREPIDAVVDDLHDVPILAQRRVHELRDVTVVLDHDDAPAFHGAVSHDDPHGGITLARAVRVP